VVVIKIIVQMKGVCVCVFCCWVALVSWR